MAKKMLFANGHVTPKTPRCYISNGLKSTLL